jgi:hypothetical protein
MLYWHIGNRIKKEILKDERAEYGQQILFRLSKELITEYGKGWSEKQLRHCLHAVETFPDEEFFSTQKARKRLTENVHRMI